MSTFTFPSFKTGLRIMDAWLPTINDSWGIKHPSPSMYVSSYISILATSEKSPSKRMQSFYA